MCLYFNTGHTTLMLRSGYTVCPIKVIHTLLLFRHFCKCMITSGYTLWSIKVKFFSFYFYNNVGNVDQFESLFHIAFTDALQ